MNKILKQFREQLKSLKYVPALFKLIWQTNKGYMVVNISLRVLRSATPVMLLFIGKQIIDTVVAALKSNEPTHILENATLWHYILIELGIVFVSEILGRGIALSESLLGDLFANQTSLEIMRHASTLDLFQFEDPIFYDKLERARRQTTGRTVLMSQVFEQVQDFITILFLGAGLIAFSPWLILILLFAIIPSLFGEIYFNQKLYSLTLGWTPQRRELDYLRFIGASDETAKEIKIFGLVDFLVERFKKISDKYFNENKDIAVRRAVIGMCLSILGTLAYYGAYFFIVEQTLAKLITLGTMTFLAGSFERMRSLLQNIMLRFSRIAESSLYLKDYFDFLEMQPVLTNTGTAQIPNPIKIGFTFENVSFKYLNSEKYAVRNLSFTLNANEKLALVGENGAGKTTVVKLLARLYEPTEGRILLDGRDLREYDPNLLRQSIGVIFQDFIKFQLVASENIAIGNIEQVKNNPLITNAAEKSLADSVVQNLPEKYEQMLGKRFNNGVDLSGGQWQKIALARAYMRDAQLLILDEPTAALDARAEHDVFVRFSELTKGKMAVLISHRFSTARMADKILVLENGTLLEYGTHESLLDLDGKYAELFNLQAAGYV